MLFNKNEREIYDEVEEKHHTAKLSHEAIAGAASYEGHVLVSLSFTLTHLTRQAAKAYENHLRTQGKPASHAKAVELLAFFAGGYVDRLAETQGLDALDRERIKHNAHEKAKKGLAESGQY